MKVLAELSICVFKAVVVAIVATCLVIIFVIAVHHDYLAGNVFLDGLPLVIDTGSNHR